MKSDVGNVHASGLLQRDKTAGVQPVVCWRQDAGLAGLELIVALVVDGQRADVVHCIAAFVCQQLLQLFHLILYAAQSFRIADVVGVDIRLCKQRVVDAQLGVEAKCSHGGQPRMVVLVIACADVVCNEAAKVRNDDTVIVQ